MRRKAPRRSLTYNQKTVRIFGTNEDPWFCGRDVCDILKYENYRQALMNNIEDENKKNLKDLCVLLNSTQNNHYNEERMTYILLEKRASINCKNS